MEISCHFVKMSVRSHSYFSAKICIPSRKTLCTDHVLFAQYRRTAAMRSFSFGLPSSIASSCLWSAASILRRRRPVSARTWSGIIRINLSSKTVLQSSLSISPSATWNSTTALLLYSAGKAGTTPCKSSVLAKSLMNSFREFCP